MLADDCCAVAAILEAEDGWTVPRLPDAVESDPLLSLMAYNVASLDGDRHRALKRMMRAGIVAAAQHLPPVLAQVLSSTTLPSSGDSDLVQGFLAPTLFQVKATLLGDVDQAAAIASWTSAIFGGAWSMGSAALPDFSFAEGVSAGPPVVLWQADLRAGRMTDEEFRATVLLFAVAGNDAMVGLAARCIEELASDSKLQADLRSADEREVSQFVMRTIARHPPVRYTFRVQPGGGLTVVSLSARKPDGVCPIHGTELVAPFGRGAHSCIGADFGVGLVEGLVHATLTRTGWISVVGTPTSHPNGMFDTYLTLPVRFSASRRATTVSFES